MELELQLAALSGFDRSRSLARMKTKVMQLSEPSSVSVTPISRVDKIARDVGDAQLMARVAQRDRAAYRELFQRYAPKIKSFHLGLKTTPAQADDLMQEVMVTIWRKAASYDPAKAAVSTWIFTLARNRFIDQIRKERRAEVPTDGEDNRPCDGAGPDEIVNGDQELTALKAALRTLPKDQSKVISMAFLNEMSHTEIATALQLPLGTVKSRIRLAILRLRDAMEIIR